MSPDKHVYSANKECSTSYVRKCIFLIQINLAIYLNLVTSDKIKFQIFKIQFPENSPMGSAVQYSNFDYMIKILLVGNHGVGKSSLLCRYCDDKFPLEGNSTKGISFKTKVIMRNDNRVKLQIWVIICCHLRITLDGVLYIIICNSARHMRLLPIGHFGRGALSVAGVSLFSWRSGLRTRIRHRWRGELFGRQKLVCVCTICHWCKTNSRKIRLNFNWKPLYSSTFLNNCLHLYEYVEGVCRLRNFIGLNNQIFITF